MVGPALAERFPGRAESWRLRDRTLHFARRPLLMGIVNVTPDSFSDGGSFLDPQAAITHGLQLVVDGADILDVGGESTRPDSQPVDVDDELQRVIPVISALCRQTDVPISIDTSKARVADEALQAGAQIINDVTGLEGDADMIDVARRASAGVCVMHMQGTPQTMQNNPTYDDVVENIYDYLLLRRDALLAAGIDRERICLDPGVGFGKTHQHNLALLAGCHRYHDLGCPILVGHSRKGFIGKILGDASADRTAGTIGVGLALASQGVHILRVHNVRPMREALLLYKATGGIDGQARDLAEPDDRSP